MSVYGDGGGVVAGELERRLRIIDVATGRRPAQLVLKNASYVNVFTQELCTCDIAIDGGLIAGMGSYQGQREVDMTGRVVVPGLIDAHIHLESAMALPAEFARAVLPHATTTVVTDPHEITNVMGEDGLEYMLQATEGLPIDVFFCLPSCVPATPFDENGADIDYRAFTSFYDHPRVVGLAEMMNYPGIVSGDADVVERVVAARLSGRVADGHAPGLSGADLCAYAASGVYSDHECVDAREALEKMRLGMHIMVREGTAAQNLDALMPLLQPRYADRVMLCTDDRHPNELLDMGHIDYILRRAIAAGADPLLVVRMATYNAARYFNLVGYGAVACGYVADLAVVDSLESFRVQQVYKGGKLVFGADGVVPFEAPAVSPRLERRVRDTFHMPHVSAAALMDGRQRGVVGLVPRSIVTRDCGLASCIDVSADILKMAVIERHRNTGHVGVGYLKGYGLARGAVATSVSHDSHNIIAVGANEDDMAQASNLVAQMGGGIVVVEGGQVRASVALPIAGLMSDAPLAEVNRSLEAAKKAAFDMGVSPDADPFMTLSFMSLSVIPVLRVTTRGVFNVETQSY